MLRICCLIVGYFALSPLLAAEQQGRPLVTFGAMGDVPYAPFEDAILPIQIDELPTNLDFAIHLGDIKGGAAPCDATIYRKVAGMLTKSAVPMFIIPGDNEWNDCPDPDAAWKQWIEHLDRFDERWELPFKVVRDPRQSQNFAFVHQQVIFIAIHVVGGRVHDAAEWKQRHADCLAWVKTQLAEHGSAVRAAVVFGHARPSPNQADLFTPFSEVAAEFGKPMLYLHGDGHNWIEDRPFEAKNVLRVQVDQGRLAPPLRVSVTDSPDTPFQFDRRLEQQPVIHQHPVDGLTSGPATGSLVIVGGAGGSDAQMIFKRFTELAGGKEARILVVPTALSSAEKFDLATFRKKVLGEGSIEPAHLALLHTRDPVEAGSEAFVAPIRDATGIWFTGGRQWRIVDAYGGTRSEEEFRAVLKRGGAIGGSSAGATIQGSFLARGDTSGNTIMLGDHQRGFAYLKNCAIDQHVVARDRQADMIDILTDPEGKMQAGHDRRSLLGLGIDEGTAAVVTGDELRVIGSPYGAVLVYDPSTWAEGLPDKHKYITLGPGSRYDLKTRKALAIHPPAPRPAKKKTPTP